MASRQTHFIALAAGALLVLSASAANAAPAYVKSTVNLRGGPSTNDEILGKIPAGSLIEIDKCDNGWCGVNWQGKTGFAIMTSIDTSGRVPMARPMARQLPSRGTPVDVGPPVYYGAPVVVGYPYYRPFGYYRYRPYYGYRYGYRRRW